VVVDLLLITSGGSVRAALRVGAGSKAEAWPFVVVVGEWSREDVVAGTGGHAGEGGSERAREGRRFWSLIARAGGTRWHRRRAVERRGRVADGRGWAGDVDDDVECAQTHSLVYLLGGLGTGCVERCRTEEIGVECKLVLVVAAAVLLRGR
jgi:hypothetical protein